MMMRIKNEYETVKLPKKLVNKIDDLIQNPNSDFTSRADLIKYAVRALFRDRTESQRDFKTDFGRIKE